MGAAVYNGLFSLSLMMGLTVDDTTLGTTGGNLGFERIEFKHPVFTGDTLSAETEVMSKRLSASRPEFGIVEFEHRAHNQDNQLVVRCRRVGLISHQPATEVGA